MSNDFAFEKPNHILEMDSELNAGVFTKMREEKMSRELTIIIDDDALTIARVRQYFDYEEENAAQDVFRTRYGLYNIQNLCTGDIKQLMKCFRYAVY